MSLTLNMVGGGGSSGGKLTVNAPAGVTVTATKDDKTKTATANAEGVATLKGLANGTWWLTIDDAEHEPSTPVAVDVLVEYAVALSFFSATINITYPEGSACIATDGTSNFTAPDASGIWALTVPSPGTWSVSAGGIREDVEITTDGQIVSVTLTDKLYVFKTGAGAATSLKTFIEDSQCYVNISADSISKGWQSNNRVTSFSSEDKIDLTDYCTLAIEYTCSDPGTGSYTEAFGISTVAAQGGVTSSILNTARASLASASTKKIATLDISGYSGEYYIGVCGAGKSVTYNLWLLKPLYLLHEVEGLASGYSVTGSLTKSGKTLEIKANPSAALSGRILPAIDVTNYSTLHIDAYWGATKVGLGKAADNTTLDATSNPDSWDRRTATINVKSMSGEYYFKAVNNLYNASITIYNLWLT